MSVTDSYSDLIRRIEDLERDDGTTPAKNLEMRGNVTSGMDRITDVPRCSVIQSVAQTITTGTITAVIFDNNAPPLDTDGFFSLANLTRITIRTQGFYLVSAVAVWFATNLGTARYAWLQKNGAAGTRYGTSTHVPSLTQPVYSNVSYPMTLNAGDYLELMVFHDTGGGGGLAFTTNGGLHPAAEIEACLIST